MHLADFPAASDLPADDDLVHAMDYTRAVCSAASSVRKANKLRNRLPLPKLLVAMPDSAQLADFADIIRDEVNVNEVELTDDVDAVGRFEVVVNAKVAGPRLGKDVQRAIKAVKAGNYERSGELVLADGVELREGLVVLDMTVTEELEAKGWAADVIRGIQDARKAADFAVSDRIAATLSVPADKEEWANRHREHIAGEVLATALQVVTAPLASDSSDSDSGDSSANVYRVLDGVSVAVQLA